MINVDPQTRQALPVLPIKPSVPSGPQLYCSTARTTPTLQAETSYQLRTTQLLSSQTLSAYQDISPLWAPALLQHCTAAHTRQALPVLPIKRSVTSGPQLYCSTARTTPTLKAATCYQLRST